MRFVLFSSAKGPHLGLAVPASGFAIDLTELSLQPALCASLALGHDVPAGLDALVRLSDVQVTALTSLAGRDILSSAAFSAVVLPLEGLALLPPVGPLARNVFCVGLNYKDHVNESGKIAGSAVARPVPQHPEFFSKPPSSLIGPLASIRRHAASTQALDYEVELAVVIGRAGEDIAPEVAMDYVFGYTVANDVTGRDLQFKHGQWFKGKGLDGTSPIGPFLVHRLAVTDPHALRIQCRINGVTMQDSNTDQLLFRIPRLIADLSKGLQLLPGDVILTGTPSGVGAAQQPPLWLKPGDVVESEVESIGLLRNVVA